MPPDDRSENKKETLPTKKEIAPWIVVLGALALTGLIWVVAMGHMLAFHLDGTVIHPTLDPLLDAARGHFGLTQFIYLVPVALWAWATKRTTVVQGVIVAAALTLLLNAACAGILF